MNNMVWTGLKRYWYLPVFAAAHALIFIVLFQSSVYNNSALVNDVRVFQDYANRLFTGSLLYKDFIIEYPPLAIVFFAIPRFFASAYTGYHTAFIVQILFFDLLGLYLLSRISLRLGFRPVIILAVYTVLIFAAGPMLIFRYDLIPAIITLASIYFFLRGNYNTAWALLAVGILAKVYPIVIAPVYLVYLLSRRDFRHAGWGIASAAGIGLAVLLPALLISTHGFISSISLQLNRGLHAETTYATVLLVGKIMGLNSFRIGVIGPTPLSVNLQGGLPDVLARIAPAITFVVLALILFLFWRRDRADRKLADGGIAAWRDVVNFSFLAVLGFLLTNSVFSPQFLIWLVPLAALVNRPARYVAFAWLAVAFSASYYFFPVHYNEFMAEGRVEIFVLLARNSALLLLALVFALWQPRPAAVPHLETARFKLQPYAAVIIFVLFLGTVFGVQLYWNKNVPVQSSIQPRFNSNGGFPQGGLQNLPGGSRPGR
jgi:uncharacterized membrane protein